MFFFKTNIILCSKKLILILLSILIINNVRKSLISFYTPVNLITKSVYLLFVGQKHKYSRFVNGNCTEKVPNDTLE